MTSRCAGEERERKDTVERERELSRWRIRGRVVQGRRRWKKRNKGENEKEFCQF
jgi:hypothetical protein